MARLTKALALQAGLLAGGAAHGGGGLKAELTGLLAVGVGQNMLGGGKSASGYVVADEAVVAALFWYPLNRTADDDSNSFQPVVVGGRARQEGGEGWWSSKLPMLGEHGRRLGGVGKT